jgi:hypothetical protein
MNMTRDPDFCDFSIKSLHAGQTYCPELNDSVVITDGSDRIFAGLIISIEKSTPGGLTGEVAVSCKDYTQELERELVVADYISQTLGEIVRDIINRYASDGIKAFSLDGTNDYISKGAVTGGTAVTAIELWIKPDSVTVPLVDLNGTAKVSLAAGVVSTAGITSPTIYVNGVATTAVTTGVWQHVVVTWSTGINASNLNLGKDGGSYYDGLIDEVVLWTATMSAGTVTSRYAAGVGVYTSATADTCLIWHADEGSGTTANDATTNANNGTLQGGATYTWGWVSSNISLQLVSDSLTTTVPRIRFNYEYATRCLQELADLYDCDWYIDYYKRLYFAPRGSMSAPISVADDADSILGRSLQLRDDLSQLRNSVFVRGGQEQYSTTSATAEQYISDGRQRVFPLGQKYVNDAIFTVETAPSPYSSWTAQTVGVQGQDDPADFDCLYDPTNRSIIYPEASKPAVDTAIRIYGNYYLPILIQKNDLASISTYGLFQFRIVDNSIGSRDEAKQRATAELVRYAANLTSGQFQTYQDGLCPGQNITLSVPSIGESGTYIVQKVTRQLHDPLAAGWVYSVEIVGKEIVDSIDVLLRLLLGDESNNIQINENEILETFYGASETIDLSDSWAATRYPADSPIMVETIDLGEVATVDPFGTNTPPVWVAGPYHPTSVSDTGRVPRGDASLACQ